MYALYERLFYSCAGRGDVRENPFPTFPAAPDWDLGWTIFFCAGGVSDTMMSVKQLRLQGLLIYSMSLWICAIS